VGGWEGTRKTSISVYLLIRKLVHVCVGPSQLQRLTCVENKWTLVDGGCGILVDLQNYLVRMVKWMEVCVE
jgi:hypothetical protein